MSKIGDQWRARKRLDTGPGGSQVYLIEREGGEQRVVKIYGQGFEPNRDVLDRLKACNEPHIIRLFDYGEVASQFQDIQNVHFYEVMEYAREGSLEDLCRVEGQKLSEDRLRAILEQIAPALSFVHNEKGLDTVHCDLKPSNILVRSAKPLDLALCDFGAARIMAGATWRHSEFMRTRLYAAPELNINQAGPKSDLWSLGLMIMELLTGAHPLQEMNPAFIPSKIAKMDVDELAEGASGRWKLLARGLLRRTGEIRWGDEEVRRWLRGDNTLVVKDEPKLGTAPQQRPFPFAGAEYGDARALSRALGDNWALARETVGRSFATLIAWARTHDLTIAVELDGIYASDDDLDLRVASTLQALDPTRVPNFCGYPMTQPGLVHLAREALADANDGRSVIQTLVQEKLITRFPESGLHAWRLELADAWQRQIDAFDAFGRALPRDTPDAVRDLTVHGAGQAYATLLLASLPDTRGEALARLRVDATSARASPAASRPWFRALLRIAGSRPSPAQLYFIAKAARAVTD